MVFRETGKEDIMQFVLCKIVVADCQGGKKKTALVKGGLS